MQAEAFKCLAKAEAHRLKDPHHLKELLAIRYPGSDLAKRLIALVL